MSNLTTIPAIDGFETTLAQAWNGAVGTVYVDSIPASTFPSGEKTYIVVNPGKTNMQVARVSAWTTGQFTVDSVSVMKGSTSLAYSQQIHAVKSKVIISDNYQFWLDIQTAINSKLDSSGGNPSSTFDLDLTGSAFRIRKDGSDMKFTDDNTPETTLTQLASGGGADQKVAVTVSDTTTGTLDAKLTAGDGLKKTVITPGGAETLDLDVDLADTTVFVATSAGLTDATKSTILNASGELDKTITKVRAIHGNSYMLGENVTAGQSLFVENMVTFASATTVQNVGDVTGNTRISSPVFGTGTSASTMKLSLRKFVSPSVNLGIRIETDNAGSPSGTLVNANATATVTAASLTTSLADTTVTFAGSFSITEGTKCHIVLFQGTYGSETINATNYYGVGYSTNNTTTRGTKLWNGSAWGAVNNAIFIYQTSSLDQEYLLSLTDADFTYKLPIDIPRISTETKSAGTYPLCTTMGLNTNQSGLTYNTTYFVSNTPGAISSTQGTNAYILGYGSNTTSLFIGSKRGLATTVPTTLDATITGASTGSVNSSVFQALQDGMFVYLHTTLGVNANAIATYSISDDGISFTTITGTGETGVSGAQVPLQRAVTLPMIKGKYYRNTVTKNSANPSSYSTLVLKQLALYA